jgi:hypothetical protein
MRTALIYPPAAYGYMPYLAPFLLKGYLHAHTGHSAEAIDLNAQFHTYTRCSLYISDFAPVRLERAGQLLRELVAHHAEPSFTALRTLVTYDDWQAVECHARILKEVRTLVATTDKAVRAIGRSTSGPDMGALHSKVEAMRSMSAGRFLERWVRAGGADGFDAVGITVTYSEQMLPTLALAAELKRRRPALPVAIGGGAVTHSLTRLLASPEYFDLVDFIVPYEGESVLGELLDALEGHAPFPTLNIATRDRQGAVVYQQDLLGKPKVSPVPDFLDLRPEHYPTPSPIYPLLTSKGCYWGKCAFCTHHEGYGQGYYRLGADALLASLEHVAQLGGDHFYFVDEAIPPRQFQQLTSMFRDRATAGRRARWMAEARLERTMVRPDAVHTLEQSGCVLLVNGIESGSQQIVDRMKKGIDLELVAEFARLCSETDSVRTGWMFFVGFPGESERQARETFEYITRHAAHVDYAAIGAFSLERGSPIWNDPAHYGISRIHGRDDPTRGYFEYELDGVGRSGYFANEALLSALRGEYPTVKALTDAAVDRAFAMFRPARGPSAAPGIAQPQRVRWHDENGRSVEYFPSRRRFEVA